LTRVGKEEPVGEDWWERLSGAFERLLEEPAESRAALLNQLCHDEPALRQELESLLAAHNTEGERFSVPAADLLAGARSAERDGGLAEGRRLGPYLVVREIGQGGMGSVFEAYRADDDFRKRVALKTIAVGRGLPAVLRRFRQERRILARLDHRHIAALLDGGIMPDGVPWFAMEYVEGEPIDRYCESRGLPLADRLQLMRQVCGAVQYAHQNLVVHRDLKPGNILVTADGTVKLLDFGIAKLLAPDEDASDPDLTEVGASPYTTAYASPEQLRGEPITTASDLHALGVVLFQMLTGRHPYREADTAQAEVRRRIQDDAPPSAGLGPDLDAILGMAMRKEPTRRYASAEQLGDDLQRWLDRLPVRARPDTLGYRLGKFARRNRVAVGASALAVTALLAAVGISATQARVAAAERDRARLEAAKANRVTAFVQEMLRAADPRQASPDLTVADALAGAARRADSALAAEPEVLAAVGTAIGLSYLGLGRYDEAEPLLRRALELREGLGPAAAPEVAASLRNLAAVHSERGDLVPAESLFRASLATYRQLPAPDSAGLGRVLNDLGDLLQYKGDLPGAETMHREALTLRQAQDGPRSEAVAASLNNIAVIQGQQGHWAVAESLGRTALDIVAERRGPRHPDVASGLNALAFVVQSQQRPVEAESLYRAALEIREAALGREHPETARTYMNLGWLLHDTGRYAEAAEQGARVLALRGRILGDDHPAVGSTLIMVGQSLLQLGRSAEAEIRLRDALRIREAALPAGHWLIAASQSALAEALLVQRRFGEAERLLLAALPVLRTERGEEAELTALARRRLARLTALRGDSGTPGR